MANFNYYSRQHLVTAMMIRPAGARPVFAGEAAEVDDIYRALGGHVRWRRLREVERELARVGVRLLLADREQLSADLLTEYLRVKQRQLL